MPGNADFSSDGLLNLFLFHGCMINFSGTDNNTPSGNRTVVVRTIQILVISILKRTYLLNYLITLSLLLFTPGATGSKRRYVFFGVFFYIFFCWYLFSWSTGRFLYRCSNLLFNYLLWFVAIIFVVNLKIDVWSERLHFFWTSIPQTLKIYNNN